MRRSRVRSWGNSGLLAVVFLLSLLINSCMSQAQVKGTWSSVIQLPTVPAAAALLPNGRVLLWSSNGQFSFEFDIGDDPSQTYTAIFNPATASSTLKVVNNSLSDMFCPGTAILPDGTLLVHGGASSPRSNIYYPATDTWSATSDLNIPRGYNASVTLDR